MRYVTQVGGWSSSVCVCVCVCVVLFECVNFPTRRPLPLKGGCMLKVLEQFHVAMEGQDLGLWDQVCCLGSLLTLLVWHNQSIPFITTFFSSQYLYCLSADNCPHIALTDGSDPFFCSWSRAGHLYFWQRRDQISSDRVP